MRYLFAVIADKTGQVAATPAEMSTIDAFNDKIAATGQRVMAAGVASPERAVLVDNRNCQADVSSRPAVDSDLFMAGFWVIEAEDDATATALATEASLACNRLIEVRPLLG